MASEADEYPALADVASDKGLSLPQPILKSMIAQTIFSVSDNESKPIHTGCLFEIEGSRLNVVAVDGYRLSVRRETVEGVPGDMKFVVRARPCARSNEFWAMMTILSRFFRIPRTFCSASAARLSLPV